MSDIDQTLEHLLLFSKMCAPEYNTSELSDRVLVFDVMHDDWERASILGSVSATTEATEPANEKPSSVSDEITSDKHNLETAEEQKLTQIEIEGGNVNLTLLNETKELPELASEQAENKQVDSPSFEEVMTGNLNSPNSDLQTSNPKIQKHEPLRQHKIYVHSHWLAAQSPYFRSLLHLSGMKEIHDKEVHLKIPESEENAHLSLLQAMYNGDVLNEKTVSELLAILELAEKYDIKFLFKICTCVLQKYATTFEISTQIMHFIKVKHNMSDVEDLATTLQFVLAKEFSPLDENWQSEKFTNLSEPSLKYLLSSDDLIVQSENTVFHSLMHWMEQNNVEASTLEETNDLLALVRFKLVTIDYLLHVIINHPIASKMPKFGELYLSGMMYHATPAEQKELLNVQPVFRKEPEAKIVQFTFVVGKEEYETFRKKKTELHSEKFWACGYKMSVVLIWESWDVYAHLNVHNLNKESLVPLEFAVWVQTHTNISWHQETFTLNVCRKKYPSVDFSSVSRSNNGTRVLYVAVKPCNTG